MESKTSVYVTIVPNATGCNPLAFNVTYYVKSTPKLSDTQKIRTSGGKKSVVIRNLSPGTWYVFAATSVGESGVSSAASNTVTIRTPPSWSTGTALSLPSGHPYLSSNDRFGLAVALSEDGSKALVGAPGVKNGTGTAYVFVKTNGRWGVWDRADSDNIGSFCW